MPDYIDWFVNRTKQYQGFCKMLARETPKAVMLIEAPADMGKTWVIQKMRHHCEGEKVPVMHVDFRDRRPHDYLSLVRLARDQLGAGYFNPLTSTINSFTGVKITLASAAGSGGGVQIDQAGSVEVGGDVAGRDIIKDNQFYIQADSTMAQRAAESQINDAFFACLDQLFVTTTRVAFLFDSYEDVTAEADRWLRDYLLPHLCEKRRANMLVVIAGRTIDELPPAFKELVAKTGLDLFEETDVREYIEKRQIAGLDMQTVIKTSGGFPGLLAKMADVASLDAKQDDDEWL
ncbi:MAG: hypothetical protein JW850_17915 [Thermoflexales bacterium]|nr:hypothetical protein [Thermoflexales bacterium]